MEIGERIEVAGAHFPQGSEIKRIRVTFRGMLVRSGLGPCSAPVEVTLTDPPEGTQEYDAASRQFRDATYAHWTQRTLRLDGTDRVAMLLNDSLFSQLTRCPGERERQEVTHATLSFGNTHARHAHLGITVEFEGITGNHSIEGTLRGATLDVLAPPSRRILYGERARAGAQRALDSLGIVLADAHPTNGGLRIASVLSGGSAQQAGIGANDILTAVDGLTVLGIEDMNLPSHARTARVAVTRNDITDDRVLELEGYATSSPTDQLATFVALLLASIVLFAALRPTAGALPSLARQANRAFGSSARMGFVRWLKDRTTDLVRGRTRAEIVPWLVLAAPATTIGLAPFLPSLLRVNWDLGLLFAAGGALRLCASPTVSFAGALQGIPTSIAAICALATSIIASGTFRAEGIVAAQAGAPWGWHSFRSPAGFVLSLLFLVALASGAPEHHEAPPNSPATTPSRGVVLRNISGWIGTFLYSAAGVTALFGGWQLPFTELNEQDGSALLQMLAAVLFLGKAWLLTLTVAWYRWAITASRTRAIVQRAGSTIIVLSLLGALVHSVYAVLSPHLPSAFATVIAQGTFVLVCVTLLGAIARPYFVRSAKLQQEMLVQFDALQTQFDPGPSAKKP